MDRVGVAVLFEPGGQGENAGRHHAVGERRKVGLAGDEIESRRMDQGYRMRRAS